MMKTCELTLYIVRLLICISESICICVWNLRGRQLFHIYTPFRLCHSLSLSIYLFLAHSLIRSLDARVTV